MTLEVERAAFPGPEELARRLESEELPLVIAGGVAHWRAVGLWSPEYLEQRIGQVVVPYKVSTSNAHPDFRQSERARMFARERAPFGDFLRSITAGPEAERAQRLFTGDEQFLLRRRANVTRVDPGLQPLLADIEVPAAVPESRLHTVWAWFSGPGVRTWLHYDNNGCHNLNAQVTGQKRCALYPPEELSRLHPFSLGGANPAHNCSAIDVERPQAELTASLAAARSWHAEISAGDLLFIPAWWWHTFSHLGPFNSNVNFWWKPARPGWNVVAARQAFLDAVSEAKLDLHDEQVVAALAALDQALINRV